MQASQQVEIKGHLLDSLTLSKVFDTIHAAGGDFELKDIRIGKGRKDFSYASIVVMAPDETKLRDVLDSVRPHISTLAPVSGNGHSIHEQPELFYPLGSTDTPKILMCPPDFYTVEYAINPWMQEASPCDTDLAKKQWETLYNAIQKEAGAEVHLMDPVDGLPDLVFTANAAFVYKNHAVIAHYKYPERQPEEPYNETWFKEKGFTVTTMPQGIHFEGAGDALIWQDRVFAGYKTRTDIASHSIIASTSGLPVLSLELINPRFYHIDVCICPLYDGHFVYYPEAFDDYGRTLIESNIPKDKRIIVSAEEAAKFACNMVNINDTVFFNKGSDRLAGELKQRGFNVVQVDLSEFIKAGGSAKCLTLRVG